MFGIDFPEIALIFFIALIVLGPQKLPKLAATVGKWVGRARLMARQFRDQLEQEANNLQRSVDLNDKPKPSATPDATAAPEPAAAPSAPAPHASQYGPPTPPESLPPAAEPWSEPGASGLPQPFPHAVPPPAAAEPVTASGAESHERG